MSEIRDPLEYVLNRMEAERDKKPPTVGYPPARKELLYGIAALRARVAELERVVAAAVLMRQQFYDDELSPDCTCSNCVAATAWDTAIAAMPPRLPQPERGEE